VKNGATAKNQKIKKSKIQNYTHKGKKQVNDLPVGLVIVLMEGRKGL
jgi:hypothetical protein